MSIENQEIVEPNEGNTARCRKGNKRDKKKESYDAEDIFPIKKLKIKNKLDRSNNGQTGVDTNPELLKNQETTEKPKPLSKRQLKRRKAEQRAIESKESKKSEIAEKCLSYVTKWKHAKNEWKFEKLRQIWLMEHLLDETSVPEEHFSTVLEYFESSKGKCREMLIQKGMLIIKQAEESETNETTEYKRARQLIQTLPN